MKLLRQPRTLVFLAVLLTMLGLFVFVVLRSGPLASVRVVTYTVENQALTPSLFGIGSVEARYTYKIGAVGTGRVKSIGVQVGDQVLAGQQLGEIDPIDLDDRIHSHQAAVLWAQAQIHETQVRSDFAQRQANRYRQLLAARSVSEEIASTYQHEHRLAQAAKATAQADLKRLQADGNVLQSQRDNLRLMAPANGLVAARDVDPGTTVVAGQAVVMLVDDRSLWVNVRFDQAQAQGLAAGLSASIVLRSRPGQVLGGTVQRIEPYADVVTEEMLVKVVFDQLPANTPIGELAEVTVVLPALPENPVVPNAAIQRQNGKLGVWLIREGRLAFIPVTLGTSDLDGLVQLNQGLQAGDVVVLYSEKSLSENSKVTAVSQLTGKPT